MSALLPPRAVLRAQALAQEQGFTASSLPEVGRLLAVLAAALPGGRIAEIGSGCGVGAAWLASGMPPDATLVTIDSDPGRAEAVRLLFADDPRVRVLRGDWRALAEHGPFQLVFADGGRAKAEQPDTVVDLLAPGGMAVLDDLTPEEHWPESWRGRPDATRDFWLHSPRLTSTEICVTECHAVILATRRV
ncbi:MAG TPA: class I SAM-dependent methyltransferase [Roseiflexaceae bacterium]|nr:class I SAM-dependent methyltransferase [Roseiflexaceae bacterium]